MWAHALSALVGLWLMASPDLVESFTETASANNRIIGPLIVSAGVVALWEVMRSVRFANTAFGVWLIISAIIFGYQDLALVTNLIAGIVTVALSLVRGEHDPLKYGGGWIALWNDDMWQRGGSETRRSDDT